MKNPISENAAVRFIISKSERRLTAIIGDTERHFQIVLGSEPAEDKQIEGDGRTPEGDLFVCVKNPKSKYKLSLGLSYPTIEDAIRGHTDGIISTEERDEIIAAIEAGRMPPQKTALGGEIYIHGGGTDGDWTEGCVALNDREMEELFELAEIGTPVTITK